MAKPRAPRASKPKTDKIENKVLQMPEAAAANGNGSSNGHNSYSQGQGDVQSQIRQRAYELYERRGATDGLAEQDWIEAEREVLASQSQKHTA